MKPKVVLDYNDSMCSCTHPQEKTNLLDMAMVNSQLYEKSLVGKYKPNSNYRLCKACYRKESTKEGGTIFTLGSADAATQDHMPEDTPLHR